MRKTTLCFVFLLILFTTSFVKIVEAKQLTVAWDYNRFFLDKMVDGFKIYMGTSEGSYPTLIANIPKSQAIVHSEKPILLQETFDDAPGTKYPLLKGNWTWVVSTKNMKIDSNEFMIVFEYPAGDSNDMSFTFWPEKQLGDGPIIYSYIKDESLPAYYELRVSSSSGTRYSNWRKVYDQKYGGIDPNGAFPLPRYPQCNIIEGQNNVCPGFLVAMHWQPSDYYVDILPIGDLPSMTGAAYGIDVDKKPLVINKLEIIINQQAGWIDDIVIGGQMELRYVVDYAFPDQKIYLAATAYNQYGESQKSVPVTYEAVIDYTKMTPKSPLQFRKLPNAAQTNQP
jgi:hypothetical protein